MCQLRVSEGVVSELQLLGLVGRMCSCTLCCVCGDQAFLLMSCMRYGFVDVICQASTSVTAYIIVSNTRLKLRRMYARITRKAKRLLQI